MYRGETLITKITSFPVNNSDAIKKFYLIFKQSGDVILEKGYNADSEEQDTSIDIGMVEDKVYVNVTLTQTESLQFQPGKVSRHIIFITEETANIVRRYEAELPALEVKQTLKDETL